MHGDLWDRDDCEQLGLEIALIADESAVAAAGHKNGATEDDLLASISHLTTIDEALALLQGLIAEDRLTAGRVGHPVGGHGRYPYAQ